MNGNDWLQVGLYLVTLLVLAKWLGWWMARVFQGQPCGLDRVLSPVERMLYRAAGVDPNSEMTWQTYAVALMAFNLLGVVVVYGVLRWQHLLPLNPQELAGVSSDLAFNTAISFASNTNWQSYGGESTLSNFSQMVALTVQNFVSAATGISVLIAFVRGLARRNMQTIGNFWVDLTRTTLFVLLPLSTGLAIALVSQGVVQTVSGPVTIELLQATTVEETSLDAEGKPVLKQREVTQQALPLGPVASQVAIKQLGTNGGGFFNVNSAHPFENPTPFSNWLEMLAILLIPAALCETFGEMIGDRRQGRALLAAMLVVFVPLVLVTIWAEQSGVAALTEMGVDQLANDGQTGGNLEGKEVRFGVVNSSLWAVATTAASNGSVNSMHDSFTPIGGLVPMWLIQLGEVIFGGVGSGLYGLLMFAIVAVFIAGLMVGRTPEYLGKKIEAFEMKMAALVILLPPIVVLIGTAVAISGPGLTYNVGNQIQGNLNNPGAHGYSEVLYAFSSAGNNNGSAFAGLTANEPFYNVALGIAMFVSRYWLVIPVLAMAGSLARKRYTPPSAGTLPTHDVQFVLLLDGAVLLVGALTFVPALSLGPVVEHLQMTAM